MEAFIVHNKGFARLVALEPGTTGGTVRVEYILLDSSDNPVAGGYRGAIAEFHYDDTNHDVMRSIAAACRVDAAEPDLEVIVIGSLGTL